MSMLRMLFLTEEERKRARDMASVAIGERGMGAEDHLHSTISTAPTRRERRIIRLAIDEVYLHYSQYFVDA